MLIRLLKTAALPALVFVTGACVLAVEIVALRVLSPYFGNTIYTASSVISVVLAGLSVGYYAGGKLADRFPSFKWFFSLIAGSGISLLILHWFGGTFLPMYGISFSLSTGPLVASLVLFFIPALLLGTLSPYAVALQKNLTPEQGIGSVAGVIFFWSTLGSIAGSLLAGFVLVPHIGVSNIIIGDGALLALLGFVPLVVIGRRRVVPIILLALALLLAFHISRVESAHLVLYSDDGLYERIQIYDGSADGRAVRFFIQDRSTSGAMYLDSDELVFDYTKYYAVYRLFKPELKRALVIGGGAYSIPKALLSDAPKVYVDVAEIEPSLFGLAKQYFNVPETPRLQDHLEDGRRFLQQSDEKYDLIFSDVYYSLYSIPAHFTTKEFFETAREKLAPDGILVMNLIGSLSATDPSFLFSEIRTVREVFPEVYVFAIDSLDSPEAQNIVIVAVNREKGTQPDFAASGDPFLRGIAEKLVPLAKYPLERYPILTDDYAPVDYMVGKMLTADFLASPRIDLSSWSGNRALADIEEQLSFGSRARGTDGHARTIAFLEDALSGTSAEVSLQKGSQKAAGSTHVITNVIARFNPKEERRIILATHYDAIAKAYADAENPDAIMPGANNSASGVALLLETARFIDALPLSFGVDIVFFDGEEGVTALGAGEAQWIPLGSTYFASHLADLYATHPEKAVVVDMVCDKDLNLYPESLSLASAPDDVERFWQIGATLAPRSFLWDGPRRAIGDDQKPLAEAGIPSLLVIDFDYAPWFNTTHDTLDKCSSESLEAIGKTLSSYLYSL